MGGLSAIKRYSYTLKSLSHVIVSPRSTMAFYLDALQDDSDEVFFKIGKKECKIIYPFYRYGEYEVFSPSEARYYIPGSSIKGVLCKTDMNPQSLFVDDVSQELTHEDFEVISLKKSQYLGSLSEKPFPNDIPKLVEFFEGVGIEAMKPGVTFSGNIGLAGDQNQANKIFMDTCRESGKRLGKYIQQIKNLREQTVKLKERDEKDNGINEQRKDAYAYFENQLDEVLKQLESLKKAQILFLGGYKGLLRSVHSEAEGNLDYNSAVFVDKNFLPFGIVEYIGVQK